MVKIENVLNNPSIRVSDTKGCFRVLEHIRVINNTEQRLSDSLDAKLNVICRQLFATLNGNTICLQAGAMEYMTGQVESVTGIRGVSDAVKKKFAAKATGETTVKPEYTGKGYLMCEPTRRHIILTDVAEWGDITLQDGLFLACDKSVILKVVKRSFITGVASGEGMFNLSCKGAGILCLESPCPLTDMTIFQLQNDTVKIDGSMAIAWSTSLQLTVEKSSKSLLGSSANGEGLVNVYRGTGTIWMVPSSRRF